MVYINNFCFFLSVIWILASSAAVESSSKCDTCRNIVKKFREGLVKTAKSNFGGGNTHWEEKNLGSYAFSETRFLEIIENVCTDGGKECHHMLEGNEEVIENWWFKHYAKGIDTDLKEFLCAKKMKVCCPSGTYGPDCRECAGGKAKPCSGNGECTGDGTKDGNGECICHPGYGGTMCNECADGFYEEEQKPSQMICKPCHNSCKSTCSEAGPSGCDVCRDGWVMVDDAGCTDLDECEDDSMCTGNEFCTNTEGSYTCTGCNAACKGCTGSTANDCKECSTRHFRDGSTCRSCHESCASSCKDNLPTSCDGCRAGWAMSESNGCEDVNECLNGTTQCVEDEYCVNTVGSYKCSTCHPTCLGCNGAGNDQCKECKVGFQRNELGQCVDVDECSIVGTCTGEHKQCTNVPGSFRCECQTNFQLQGNDCVPKTKEVPKPTEKPNPNGKSSSKADTKKTVNSKQTSTKKKSNVSLNASKEELLKYFGTLGAFSLLCTMIKRSVVAQTVFTGAFSIYMYWYASLLDGQVKVHS